MQESTDQPASPAGPPPPADESGGASPDAASPHREPELDALVDAAWVLLSGWASLGLRVSKLVLREGARSLEQGARVLESLATVIEKKLETPTDSGSSGA